MRTTTYRVLMTALFLGLSGIATRRAQVGELGAEQVVGQAGVPEEEVLV